MADANLIMPSTIRVAAAKPRFGIYYALLIIAFCAMIVSCGILYKFVRDFGGFGSVKGRVSMIERTSNIAYHRVHREHGVRA
jgi:hypothetical protein